jgi:guanine deaminase
MMHLLFLKPMSRAKNKPHFLSIAAKEGLNGIHAGHGGPFGAVVVHRGKILARGHNTVLATNNPTRHAEINAITVASKKLKRFSLKDCEIYSSTEPCPMCFSAIHWARIATIVYATTIQDVKRLGFNELCVSNNTLKRLGRTRVRLVRQENRECSDLLLSWKK